MGQEAQRWTGTVLAVALAGVSWGAPVDADPWIGKTEADLVALLGEPARSKPESDGGRTLSYKLLRLDESPPPPGVMPVLLPGVGLVGVTPREHGSPGAGTAQLGPLELDPEGRTAGGGYSETSSASTSWDAKTGEKKMTATGDGARVGSRGKLTLKFQIAPDGSIRGWTSSDGNKKDKE